MSQRDKIIASLSALAILTVLGFIIFGGGKGSSSRSSALDSIRSTMNTNDLIRERGSIVKVLNFSHDDPAAKPENIKKLKQNLSNIDKQLVTAGVDLSTLEPQPEWDS